MSSDDSRNLHCPTQLIDPLLDQALQGKARRAMHAPRVLLVEDDRGVRNATRMLLKAEGYDVAVAGSMGEALLQVAEQPDVQLLIIALRLGNDQTGLQVIAAVCRRIARHLKAILITADMPASIHDMHGDAGLQVVTNPIDVENFLLLVRGLTAH